MKHLVLALFTLASFPVSAAPGMPMSFPMEETAWARWLQKPVLDSRPLDGMESLDHWKHFGPGELTLTRERSVEGESSLRLVSPTVGTEPPRVVGRPFAEAVARRVFDGEDWRAFNRISVRVYPHLPGFKVISLLLKLNNDGAEKVPDAYGREGLQYVLLKPDEWNPVVFEIEHLARDRVTGVDLIYRLQGNEPGSSAKVQFDFDRLELQRVPPDHFEGWAVAPKRMAYSHAGYLPQGEKIALVAGTTRAEFRVLRREGSTAFRGTARPVRGQSPEIPRLPVEQAEISVLDFSGLTTPGEGYVLEMGDLRSRPFSISSSTWISSLWKTLNFFYCERCGQAIAGIHDICHQDWRAEHNGTSLRINGGWHDAGDLSQGLVNTSEATLAMFELASGLGSERGTFPGLEADRRTRRQLSQRLLEEGTWGLEWILKTRFEDGFRVTWATMDYWTDGLLGTVDDTLGEVRNTAYDNFTAAGTEAVASRVLARQDPKLAGRAAEQAQRDWQTAISRLREVPNLETAAVGTLASIELFKISGDPLHSGKAVELARAVLASQQQDWTKWRVPMIGFFHTDPKRQRLLHYSHRGHEQAPIVALRELCRTLPEHPEWMDWYTAVVLHSEYLWRLGEFTDPYHLIPASVYRLDESEDLRFRNQVLSGFPLDERHYLRVFPVWFDLRGNSGTVLSQAKALSAAAALRGGSAAERLMERVQRQLQWHVGLNPFAQSLMFGEGYDYAPQYTAMSGDMVGSLPVGVQTRQSNDAPYWSTANCYNYKEVWVHPSSRWLWILADFNAPIPRSAVPWTVEVVEESPERVVLSAVVPAGIRWEGMSLRGSNLDVPTPRTTRRSDGSREWRWDCRRASATRPWVAVVHRTESLSDRREVLGLKPPSDPDSTP